jgi:hypothetical protein
MKHTILSLGIVAVALGASTAAFASTHVSVDINPFGSWGAPPPVVYESPRYYAPPGVYYGHGRWGDRHDARRHHDERGLYDHHDDHRR